MIELLIRFIQFVAQVLTIVVIIDIFLSYFMSPYQPVRQYLDRVVAPMLNPIRRVVPPIGMIDFSPLVLIILIQVIANVLIRILVAI